MDKKLTEKEIDQLVFAKAKYDTAWESPILVRRAKPASLTPLANLAVWAAFLARLHCTSGVEEWLTQIIQEKVKFGRGCLQRGEKKW
jgi:hypothetical protein